MAVRRLIIIRGPSSVGKTTVGLGVARRLGFNFIDEDDVRHEYEGDWLSHEAFLFSLRKLSQMTKEGCFVVAGCFVDSKQMASCLSPDTVFYLHADVSTLLERNLKYPPEKRMPEDKVQSIYDMMECMKGEILIETLGKTLEGVVQEIVSLQT